MVAHMRTALLDVLGLHSSHLQQRFLICMLQHSSSMNARDNVGIALYHKGLHENPGHFYCMCQTPHR